MGSYKYNKDWRKPLIALQTNEIQVGRVLYFASDKLQDKFNDEPHYFIVVAIDGNTVYFLCCQSSSTSANNQVKYKGKDPCTIPCIKPTTQNQLKMDSYVDCNNTIDYCFEDLENMFESQKVGIKGTVSLGDYLQLKEGIIQSPTNDLPEDILIHPED